MDIAVGDAVRAGAGVVAGATVASGVTVSDEQAAITTAKSMASEANRNVSCLDVIEAPFRKQVKVNRPVACS